MTAMLRDRDHYSNSEIPDESPLKLVHLSMSLIVGCKMVALSKGRSFFSGANS